MMAADGIGTDVVITEEETVLVAEDVAVEDGGRELIRMMPMHSHHYNNHEWYRGLIGVRFNCMIGGRGIVYEQGLD